MLSVVVPVFNEGANIVEFLNTLSGHVAGPYEVLAVYDLDEDNTVSTIAALQARFPQDYTAVRLVKNFVHRGPSGALRTGFAEAKGDEILVAMADLSDDLSQIEALRARLRSGCAIVCPSRYCKGGEQRLKSIRATIPRWVGYVLRWLTGVATHDPTNSFRLYSRQVLSAFPLKSTHSFSITLEILAKAHCLGMRIEEIPTVWVDRRRGVSKFPFLTSLITYLPWFGLALSNSWWLRLPLGLRRRLVGTLPEEVSLD